MQWQTTWSHDCYKTQPRWQSTESASMTWLHKQADNENMASKRGETASGAAGTASERAALLKKKKEKNIQDLVRSSLPS